jgi:phage repressor protein C with HTH and peptisase S24 domain
MTKGLYISIFVLGALLSEAQTNLYGKLNSFLNSQTKEAVSNRLIAVNLWSVNDNNSRNLNKEFEKVYSVYEYAKLKGGNKGIIVLTVNVDKDNLMADITLKKDGINKTIKVPFDNIDIMNEISDNNSGYNIVFDSNGNKVYENLTTGNVFNSIQKLITR